MTWDPWAVTPLDERPLWELRPWSGVGPLWFWMTHPEVETAMGQKVHCQFRGDQIVKADFDGVTTYYEENRLFAVAVDARKGPQVHYKGGQLIGQPPSDISQWFVDNNERLELEVRYSQEGDPTSEKIGTVMRAQRAGRQGDTLLSRGVFVSWQWSDRCGDTQESPLPDEEWRVR